LWLNGCELLLKLPPTFSKLTKLRKLSIEDTRMEELPEHFGQLYSLKVANFQGCKSLVQLPELFGNL
jgi:Leucine-rich repeat (LRR) protein